MAAPDGALPPLPGLPWRGTYEFTLENGLRVLFVQRDRSPIIELRMVLDAGGFATDPDGRCGLAAVATALFSDGLIHVNGAQLASALDELGATVQRQLMPDAAVLGISALKTNFEDVLRISGKALTQLEFTGGDFELSKAQQLALIAGERVDPLELPLRVLPALTYGRGHAYARPFSGSGTEKDIAKITFDNVRSYYAAQMTPDSTRLIIVGSCATTEVGSLVEAAFGKWDAWSPTALPTPVSERLDDGRSMAIVNRPGAAQTVIAAGLPTVARNSVQAEPLIVADAVLAGSFSSRLNSSLRERKGWTYGVRSLLLDARLQGLWLIRTAVRNDCTVQATAEIACELANLAGLRPVTADEFSRAISYLFSRMPSSYETSGQIADAFANFMICQLPFSYPENLAARLRRLTPADLTESCRHILSASGVKWVVIGEAAELGDRFRQAGFSGIQIIDSNSADLP